MDRNAYQPPQSNLVTEEQKSSNQFYQVSKKKLTILFLATLGLYAIYWFYVNWKNQRDYNDAKVIPFLRAIFYVFFTHSLFGLIEQAAKLKDDAYRWASQSQATLFIILAIIANAADRMSAKELGSPYSDFVSLLILPVLLIILRNAQDAINLSQDDPEGITNSKMTAFNYIWIFLGVLLWSLVILGLIVTLGLLTF